MIIWTSTILIAFIALSCANKKNRGTITASGTIEAVEVNIAAKTSGQVEKLWVDEGSRVMTGDTLAAIDSSSLKIQLNQAEAGVKLAEAQLELLLKGARIEDIRQAEETVTQAEANLRTAEEDWKRIQNLFDKQSATAKQRDDAESRHTIAQAQQEAARQNLQKLRNLARPEEVKAAQARLEQAIASRDLLKKTIADATVISPASGIVTHKAIEQGEFVGLGITILTVAELDEVHLEIFVAEAELGRLRLGQTAEVRIDSYPDRAFGGQIIFISPEAEFTPKNIQTKEERVKLVYRVKIKIPNPENILKSGMPADATIDLSDDTK